MTGLGSHKTRPSEMEVSPRLLNYQSPLIFFRSLNTSSNSFESLKSIRSWKTNKDNFNLKILLDHKSSDLNQTYLLLYCTTAGRKNWTHTYLEPPTHFQMKLTSPEIGPSRCARNTLQYYVIFCNTLLYSVIICNTL